MDLSRDYNLYAVFMKVCEIKSYSKVAEELGYSAHQSISDKMVTLAKQLGVKTLFVRHSRGVVPTAEALKLYNKVRALFGELSLAEDDARDFDKYTKTTIRMCIPSTIVIFFSEYFKEFNQKYPNVKFDFHSRPHREDPDITTTGGVDFVIDLKQVCEKYSLKTIDLFTHECIFIASNKYLESEGLSKNMTKEQFLKLQIIAHNEFIKKFINRAELPLELFMATSTADAIFDLVKSGLGAGQFFEKLFDRIIKIDKDCDVVKLNIRDLKLPKITISCGYNYGQISKASKAFIDGLAEYCQAKI